MLKALDASFPAWTTSHQLLSLHACQSYCLRTERFLFPFSIITHNFLWPSPSESMATQTLGYWLHLLQPTLGNLGHSTNGRNPTQDHVPLPHIPAFNLTSRAPSQAENILEKMFLKLRYIFITLVLQTNL